MNLANLLLRTARSFGDRPAVFEGDRQVHDYRSLLNRVATLAGDLTQECGLQPGDRVALVMHNSPAYVELLFAAWHAGLVVVPINAKLHAREFAYILQHSGARLCFVSDDLAEAVAGVKVEAPDLGWIVSVDSTEFRRMTAGKPAPMIRCGPDETAWLFYTSGTTGRPKGAMLSHRNLLAMMLSYFADVDSIGPQDCILHAAPMSHGSGLYILPHVAQAAAQVIPETGKFDPQEIFDLLKVHRGASMFAAPTIVKCLVEHPGAATAHLGNLKTIIYGGAPMYLEDLRRALESFGQKFVQIYGQGESPMTITALSRARHADVGHPRYLERLASVGVAQTTVELRVADAEDRELPAGHSGEVLVRGDTVMVGYWNDAHATAAALRGGWLHTGDLGAIDEDGFLTLKDRSKDLIISGGSNIYPREIEEVLLKHQEVREASVVGRPHPEWGEEVVAFVVPASSGAVDEQSLDALCREHIARFKRPRVYRFVESLPKNNYGKVLKTELRQRLANEQETEHQGSEMQLSLRDKSTMASPIALQKRDSVGWIRLDDGRVNAIQDRFLSDLNDALDNCQSDEDIRCIVVVGRPGVFSAGLDLKVLPALPPEQLKQTLLNFGSIAVRLFTFPKPTIAAVTGHAIAGGAVFSLCCDVRLGTAGDFKWGLTEAAIGIALPEFISLIAVDAVPTELSAQILLHGVTLSSFEARQAGIFHALYPPDAIEAETEQRARKLANLSPAAYRTTKRRLRAVDYLAHFPAEIDEFVNAIKIQTR